MDTIQRIAAQQEQIAKDKVSQERHIESVLALTSVEKAVYSAVQTMLKYLDTKVTQTEVLNQPQSIHTPDVQEVVQAVKSLEQVTNSKDVDLSPILDGLNKLEEQLKLIPKENPEFEKTEEVKVTNLDDIDFSTLEAAIKGIKLDQDLSPLTKSMLEVVKAVHGIKLEQQDLSPLQQTIKDVEKAVKAIEIPETKLDTSEIEKQLKTANTTLEKLYKKPTGGSGGGGSSWVATNSQGISQPLTVVDGVLQTNVFAPNADITTDLSTPGVIVETDGVRTLTTTITGTEITEVWS